MKELYDVGLASLVVIEIALAFSRPVRKQIGYRDKWQCQWEKCTRSFQKGYMVQAAHYDHDKSDPNYDTVDAGRILCTTHHIQDHIELGDIRSAKLIKRTQSIYTFDRQKHPEKYR